MTAAMMIGTAGWNVPARYAPDFPADGSHLERYAARLNAVEINSSFYRPHRRTTYARWAESVPEGFRFAVKVPKSVTHERHLDDCDAPIERFADEVAGLGPKLGVLLVQLPPSLPFRAGPFHRVIAGFRRDRDVPIACEPRHASWFTPEAEACLVAERVARVAADPPPVPAASEPGGWRGFAYLRLHGAPQVYYSPYETPALLAIGRRLAALQAAGVPSWCIFDNTAAFHALGDALALMGAR